MPTDHDRSRLLAEFAVLQQRWQENILPDFVERVLTIRLTTQQLKVLALIVPEPQGRSIRELADVMAVTLPTVSGLIDRLTEHGMVRRLPDPHDQRVRRVVATDSGRDVFRRLANASLQTGSLPLDALTTEELAALVRASTALLRAMHR